MIPIDFPIFQRGGSTTNHFLILPLVDGSPFLTLGGSLPKREGKLHLVDLAGSECAKKGGLIYSEDSGRSGRSGRSGGAGPDGVEVGLWESIG